MKYYMVLWDNGHACDAFPTRYESEQAAEDAGNDWRNEMIAIEPTRKEKKAAAEAYSFEVIEKEEPDDEEQEEYLTPQQMGWVDSKGRP